MALFHISSSPSLERLEPRTPQHRAAGEPNERCVCAAGTPLSCAMAILGGVTQAPYLYQILPEDEHLFSPCGKGRWLDSGAEWRAYVPVRVELVSVEPCWYLLDQAREVWES